MHHIAYWFCKHFYD